MISLVLTIYQKDVLLKLMNNFFYFIYSSHSQHSNQCSMGTELRDCAEFYSGSNNIVELSFPHGFYVDEDETMTIVWYNGV